MGENIASHSVWNSRTECVLHLHAGFSHIDQICSFNLNRFQLSDNYDGSVDKGKCMFLVSEKVYWSRV